MPDPIAVALAPVADPKAATASPTAAIPAGDKAPPPRTTAEATKRALTSMRREAPPTANPTSPAAGAKESPAPAEGTEDPPSTVLSQSSESNGDGDDDAKEGTGEADDKALDGGGDPKIGESRWPKSAVERNRKLKLQRNEARDKLAATQARLREVESQRPASEAGKGAEPVNAADPFDGVVDAKVIAQTVEEAQDVVQWCQKLIEEMVVDPSAVEEKIRGVGMNLGDKADSWSPQNILKWIQRTRDNAAQSATAGPKRLEYLRAENQAIKTAVHYLPDLDDEESTIAQTVGEVLRQYPQLQQRPDWMWQASIYALGHQAMLKLTGQRPAVRPAAGAAAGAQAASAAGPAASAPALAPSARPRAPGGLGAPKSAPAGNAPDELEVARGKMKTEKGLGGAEAYARAALKRAIPA